LENYQNSPPSNVTFVVGKSKNESNKITGYQLMSKDSKYLNKIYHINNKNKH